MNLADLFERHVPAQIILESHTFRFPRDFPWQYINPRSERDVACCRMIGRRSGRRPVQYCNLAVIFLSVPSNRGIIAAHAISPL